MRVFVAGAGGYLGHFVITELCKRGHEVIAAILPVGEEEAAERLVELGARVQGADATQPATLIGLMDGCDAVISCMAASSKLAELTGDFFAVDRDGTIAVFEEARRAKVGQFLLVATFEGPDSRKYTEFSEAKEAAVDYIVEQAPKSQIDWTVIRPTAYYKDLLRQAWKSVSENRSCMLIGSGETRINPVDGADVAAYIADCVEQPTMRNKSHPIGGPEIVSMRKLNEIAAEVAGCKDTLKIKRISIWLITLIATMQRFIGLFSRKFRVRSALLRWIMYASTHDAIGQSIGKKTIQQQFIEWRNLSRL